MAFDKFRKVPLDDAVMENLYNLALDFERRRQFNKAENVFRYMAEYNPKFRDIGERLGARQEAVRDGHPRRRRRPHQGQHRDAAPAGSVEKPMLGRYQVEKELGKGAMGVVYRRQGSEDRPRGRDQDHGAVAGVRGRRAART